MTHGRFTARLRPANFTKVSLADPFWTPRLEINRNVTIPFALNMCQETGRIDNFAKAGKLMKGEFRGIYYDDSDVFKVLEGAAYTLATHPDPELDRLLDDIIAKIAAAQEADGYLYTNRTIDPANTQKAAGTERWCNVQHSHELYNVGHLYEAAVAHFQATGKRSLLDVAIKSAELILHEFGPAARHDPPGHEEIEIGLARLFDVTGDDRYLALASFFLDQRGRGHDKRPPYGTYAQDHLPVTEQSEVVGHAVRALYLYSGMADVAVRSGESQYLAPLDTLWRDVVERKLALTGGVGARKTGEAFGDPYELPNFTCYNETCSAIANVFWNHRLFLLTGESQYLDVLERSLYNGALAGVSLSGDRFFYVNPLASDGLTPFNYGGELTRAPWFKCSCCPVNIARLLASLGGYVYASDRRALCVNLYIAGHAEMDVPEVGRVCVTQQTRYPWDGRIDLTIDPPAEGLAFAIKLRIPGWAQGSPVPGDLYKELNRQIEPATATVNGQAVPLEIAAGFAVIDRTWRSGDRVQLTLPMAVRRTIANDQVEENRGKVALERGPLVYCVEQVDHSIPVTDITIADTADLQIEHRNDLLGGVTVVRDPESGLLAVPYYAWSNRGISPMAVWLRRLMEKERRMRKKALVYDPK